MIEGSKLKIFLHTGAPKTATTFLQHCFYSNREKLIKLGYCYPEVDTDNCAHHKLAVSFLGRPHWANPDNESAETIINRLRDEAISHDCHSIIISSEAIFGMFIDPRLIREAFGDFQLTYITYLRRQDSYFMSLYGQELFDKGENRSFDDFCDSLLDSNFSYLRHYKLLQKNFGRENVIFRPFERRQLQSESIFRDFLSLIGIGALELEGTKHLNTSLAPEVLLILRTLNFLDTPIKMRQIMARSLQSSFQSSGGSTLISDERSREIQAVFENDNQKLSKLVRGGTKPTPFFLEELQYGEKKKISSITTDMIAKIGEADSRNLFRFLNSHLEQCDEIDELRLLTSILCQNLFPDLWRRHDDCSFVDRVRWCSLLGDRN